MKYYTGIGAREHVPLGVLVWMSLTAMLLEYHGYTLRSGGAKGSDKAFEAGVLGSLKEIYLPWKGFKGNTSKLFTSSAEAVKLAAKFHPAWDRCSTIARKFHARNSHQILGRYLDSPSEFVICWTKGGEMVGGTAQALRIAQAFSIPIINLGSEDGFVDLENLQKKLSAKKEGK